MSLRKVATVESFDHTRRAVVHRDTDSGEFRVAFTLDGVRKPRADYFTDDRTDAIGTARAMCDLSPLIRG